MGVISAAVAGSTPRRTFSIVRGAEEGKRDDEERARRGASPASGGLDKLDGGGLSDRVERQLTLSSGQKIDGQNISAEAAGVRLICVLGRIKHREEIGLRNDGRDGHP